MFTRSDTRARGSDGDGLSPAVLQAYLHLERMIELKAFPPGGRLPTAAALASDIGVSRPVVLDALSLLERQGRIRLAAGSGIWVLAGDDAGREMRLARIRSNAASIAGQSALRMMVEPGASVLAAERGMDTALVAEARALLESMNRVTLTAHHERHALDARFHLLIAKASGFDEVEAEVERLRVGVGPVFEFLDFADGREKEALAEHRQILQAIVKRRPEDARRVTLEHVKASDDLIQGNVFDLPA